TRKKPRRPAFLTQRVSHLASGLVTRLCVRRVVDISAFLRRPEVGNRLELSCPHWKAIRVRCSVQICVQNYTSKHTRLASATDPSISLIHYRRIRCPSMCLIWCVCVHHNT